LVSGLLIHKYLTPATGFSKTSAFTQDEIINQKAPPSEQNSMEFNSEDAS